MRNFLQPAGADAVGAFFVFLHLLERQAELIGEPFLAHVQHEASHANTATDILVGRIREFYRHHESPGPSSPVLSLFNSVGNPRLQVFRPLLRSVCVPRMSPIRRVGLMAWVAERFSGRPSSKDSGANPRRLRRRFASS